ncbi:MAG: ABC transporter ATP-binding protein [Desulfurivibrio sp.]|nr:MAG: ABC transporter ATP-binding protein [Desulfurivibrio sp.]
MLIVCEQLSKTYRADAAVVQAVADVNLEVAGGDFVVILGHSGSGKTTLLSLIGGLTSPDHGIVRIHGRDNWGSGDTALSLLRNRTIGFIFQFASLIPTLTALENVLLPLYFQKRTAKRKERALDLLAAVGLTGKAGAYPAQLSGGQQRRVAIARAFINEPEIILADEPTGDLDEETEADILTMFARFHQQGTTFLVVTHNAHLAVTQRNSRILHMKNGRLAYGQA